MSSMGLGHDNQDDVEKDQPRGAAWVPWALLTLYLSTHNG